MVPAIKVYKMDYSFIIKNYLNVALWKKTWTLFEFKDYVITLQLSRIETTENKIMFTLKFKDNGCDDGWNNSIQDYVWFHLKLEEVKYLIKKINSTVFVLINRYERLYVLEETEAYKNLELLIKSENEKLKYIAEKYLDENNVTNSEIREVYVDNYVSQNNKADDIKTELRDTFEYHLIPDLYLVFLKSIEDEHRYKKVLEALEENETSTVLEEISNYQEIIETDCYEEEMTNLLEAI